MNRLLPLVLLLGTGCATSLASGHSAKVLDKGRVEVTVGSGAMVPVGVLTQVVEAGKAVAKDIAAQQGHDGQIKVDGEKARKVAIAGAALVASPPSLVNEFTVRYGLVDRLDVGLRLSGPAIRGEVHGQVYDGAWKVAAGAAVARHTFESPVLDLLDKFNLASFKRTDVEVEVLAGREWEFGALYFGPKAMWSKFSSEGLLVHDDKVVVPNQNGTPGPEVLELGQSFIYGGLVGGRVGWKYVWLMTELGVYGSTFKPTILGREENLGGLVVFPSVGIAGRY